MSKRRSSRRYRSMLRMAGKISSTIAKLNTTTTAAWEKKRSCNKHIFTLAHKLFTYSNTRTSAEGLCQNHMDPNKFNFKTIILFRTDDWQTNKKHNPWHSKTEFGLIQLKWNSLKFLNVNHIAIKLIIQINTLPCEQLTMNWNWSGLCSNPGKNLSQSSARCGSSDLGKQPLSFRADISHGY